jgi:hypothetical protein
MRQDLERGEGGVGEGVRFLSNAFMIHEDTTRLYPGSK